MKFLSFDKGRSNENTLYGFFLIPPFPFPQGLRYAMHFTLAEKGGFVYAPQAERQNDSVAFRQLCYSFGTYFAYKAPLVPAVEIVK